MKLSDAILRGSTMGPQIRHQLSNGKGTCAWGAAYLALGILGKAITQDPRADPRVIWPWTKAKFVNCPVCWEKVHVITAISDHLNDSHFWTRERIAEWVARVEPSEPVVPSHDAVPESFATFRSQSCEHRSQSREQKPVSPLCPDDGKIPAVALAVPEYHSVRVCYDTRRDVVRRRKSVG